MKQLAKGLVVIGALAAAGTANANWFEDFTPLVGADFEWTRMDSGHRHGRHFFKRTYTGGNVYIGGRFCECWGLELGYDWTGSKHTRRTFTGPQTFDGVTLAAGQTLRTRGKARFNSWHFDVLGYLPLDECFELIGTIGYGWGKARVHAGVEVNDTAGNSIRFGGNGRGHGNKGYFRIGAGAQYMITECFGIRGLVRWKNTERLGRHRGGDGFVVTGNRAVFTGVNNFGINRGKLFKDAWTFSLGAFFKF